MKDRVRDSSGQLPRLNVLCNPDSFSEHEQCPGLQFMDCLTHDNADLISYTSSRNTAASSASATSGSRRSNIKKKIEFVFPFFKICVGILLACMSMHNMGRVFTEIRRGCWMPWDWGYRQL